MPAWTAFYGARNAKTGAFDRQFVGADEFAENRFERGVLTARIYAGRHELQATLLDIKIRKPRVRSADISSEYHVACRRRLRMSTGTTVCCVN